VLQFGKVLLAMTKKILGIGDDGHLCRWKSCEHD
jgi:hypothetical protein